MCDKVVCDEVLCDKVIEDAEEEAAKEADGHAGGCQSKNKNPTQFCGEKPKKSWHVRQEQNLGAYFA